MLIGGRGKSIGEGFIIITILVVVILLIAVITVSVKKEGFDTEKKCRCYFGYKKGAGGSCNYMTPLRTCLGCTAPPKQGVYGNYKFLGGNSFMNNKECEC
jgi:hypothetical protein